MPKVVEGGGVHGKRFYLPQKQFHINGEFQGREFLRQGRILQGKEKKLGKASPQQKGKGVPLKKETEN
jgi:hypothetical protein